MNVRLTLEERQSVACLHSATQWVLDTETPHMVCFSCGKPSTELVIRKCSEEGCGDEFIMNFGPDWLPKYFVVDDRVYEREFFCPTCY